MNDATSQQSGESLWARLRRRKLVQWGLAYAAGAWGFQQGLAYVSTLLGWPVQVQRLTGLALLIGLPIALVLAWYHGDRGQRQVTRIELAILTLLFLLGGGVFWYFQRASETSTVTSQPSPGAPTFATDASIAVLPFVNMSSDKEQEYFADGISEELLNLLAQVPELRVIARTSSFSFKGKEVDIAEIARRLNVANVLEGSVRKAGDKLRITAQLVRASDSSHLWSHTYDRQMTDVFEVQDEIAAVVVGELKIRLLGEAPKSRVTDPRAYAVFLQARDISRQYTAAAFEQSVKLHREALVIDPTYAAAWEGLAYIYCSQVDAGLRLPNEGRELALESTTKALALDPHYASAHARLGWIAMHFDLDLVAAARHLETALSLDPSNTDALMTAAILLRRLGRLRQGIALGQYVLTRDPVNADAHADLGNAYRYAGRLADALVELRLMDTLSPGGIGNRLYVAEVLLQQGAAETALSEIQQEPSEQWRLIGLALVRHALGQRAEADAALASLIGKYASTSAYRIAYVLAYRGDVDAAFRWLEKAVEYKELPLGSLPVYPMFANIHSDARWLPFLRKHGMAPEQLAAIKFDVKVPN